MTPAGLFLLGVLAGSAATYAIAHRHGVMDERERARTALRRVLGDRDRRLTEATEETAAVRARATHLEAQLRAACQQIHPATTTRAATTPTTHPSGLRLLTDRSHR